MVKEIIMKGIGIHVFAGGFTMGMKKALPVAGQLEIHNFGRETCEAHDTKFMNAENWKAWDDYRSDWKDCNFCYGNPRCTAFSSYSAGAGKHARGPRAEPTRDIWDLCYFGIKAKLDLIAFESVQQAYSVGRPLLNTIKDELFVPNNYRIAHLFVNTAAEGNAQKRRRYFFVAYKNNRNFNIMVPEIPKYRTTVGDVLKPFIKRKTKEGDLKSKQFKYDFNTYSCMNQHNKNLIPALRDGENFHKLARERLGVMKTLSPYHYKKWIHRTSNLPFSLHAPTRIKWNGNCPTICSTSHSLIHPKLDRSLTVGEIAALMGWPKGFIPVGRDPIGQIGKGVVPATGQWLGEQIKLYLEDYWGEEDFESTFCHKYNEWIGTNYSKHNNTIEKVFRLTSYIPPFKEIA